jgi:hypothetical protein
MHILSLFCRESSHLNLLAKATDPDHFVHMAPDPHQFEKLNPDPDRHQSEKQDPDRHQNEKVDALEGHLGAVEGPNMGKSELSNPDPH